MCEKYIFLLSLNPETDFMKRLLLTMFALCCVIASYSQLLTWTPPFPRENDAAQTLVITMDATKGNAGLLNHAPTDVYVHIGVITSKSTSSSDWKYVKFTWATTPAAANAVYIGNNKWTYTITGSLRTFFGITDATEMIQKIAILFRDGAGNKVQRNTNNSDMYLPVYNTAPAVRIFEPPTQPTYVPTPEIASYPTGTYTIKSVVSGAGTFSFFLNGSSVFSGPVSAGDTIANVINLPSAGFYQLVARISNGTVTHSDTLQLQAGSLQSPVAALPADVRDGINYEPGDTSVTLVLSTPNAGKNLVALIGEFNNWQESTAYIMNKTADGKKFWLRLTGLTPGREYRYQYKVDGSLRIPDPYAEKLLDPNNDGFISPATYPNLISYPAGQSGIVSVLQTAAPAYNWSVNTYQRPDKRNLIIYELLLRDFLAAHDWKTLADTLSYLKRLGVNAIEVMPFNEFEGNISWGYNGYQYFAPDKYYGPKNTLKRFVDSCHKHGIMVIMDIVLNHTYGPSPLKELYPMSANPWYNATPPHSAISFGDDFNHQSIDTKQFFGRVLKHWLTEYRIDGYRFDFSKGMTQRVTTTDGAMSAYDDTRIAILKAYADSARIANPNAYIILEHFADNQEEKELSDNGMLLWANVWHQYQEASMGHLQNSNFEGGIHSFRGWTNPHLVTFMESHDEERITFKNIKYGNSSGSYNIRDTATALRRMELNAAFLLTIPGPKMIWQFGELGYDYSRCHLSTNGEGGDCNRKTDPKPIRWDYATEARRKRVYDVYAGLNRLRQHPWYNGVFQSATIDRSLGGAFKWIKLTTTNDTSDLVVVGNFDVNPQTGSVTFPVAGTWYDYFANTTISTSASPQSFTLQPGEYRVYVNRNVNNVTTTSVGSIPVNPNAIEVNLYPNPVDANSTIEIKLPQSGQTTIELYNSTGQFVRTVYSGFLARGVRQLPLQRPTSAKGTYFLKVRTKDDIKTIPFTLQ